MDKKIAQIVQDVMGKGEKVAPVKSIKLKVKFQEPTNMVKSKKSIVKKAVKSAKDDSEEKNESAAVRKAEGSTDDETKTPASKYKNLGKK